MSWTGAADAARFQRIKTQSRWRHGPLLLLFLLGTAGGLEAARPRPPDAAALLRKAERAEQRVAYIGTKVVRRVTKDGGGSGEQEVKVWHAPPDKTRLVVLPPSRIAGLVTVEVGDLRFHYHPWRERWQAMPRPYQPPLELLLKNYSVRDIGTATIAGRKTRAVQIRSRHPGNRQKNLWIDRATGIVLKSEILDETGRRVSWWQFRQIEFPTSIPAALFSTPNAPPPESSRPAMAALQRMDKPDFAVAELRYLPPGYSEVRRAVYRSRGQDRVVIRFTDGLNVILFVQQRDRPSDEGARSRRRDDGRKAEGGGQAEAAASRQRLGPPRDEDGNGAARVNWKQGDLRLTLVGGVERPQLERMAASACLPGSR